MKDLVEAMAAACSFVEGAEPLRPKSRQYCDIINNIISQVIQCAYFVEAYCRDKNFGKVMLPMH